MQCQAFLFLELLAYVYQLVFLVIDLSKQAAEACDAFIRVSPLSSQRRTAIEPT